MSRPHSKERKGITRVSARDILRGDGARDRDLLRLGAAIVALGGGISAGLKSELKNREATRAHHHEQEEASLAVHVCEAARLARYDHGIRPGRGRVGQPARLARYGLILAKTRSLDTIPTISVDSCAGYLHVWHQPRPKVTRRGATCVQRLPPPPLCFLCV